MLEIKVTVPQEAVEERRADVYLANAMAALGFHRGEVLAKPVTLAALSASTSAQAAASVKTAEAVEGEGVEATTAEGTPKRERGKPAPGKARRTKEEIAEDEAADKADAEAAGEPKSNISTGEERFDPATPEQDAADEADEAADEANQNTSGATTRDDVRNAMTKFMDDFGGGEMVNVLAPAFERLYPDGSVKNLKSMPEDPEKFAAILKILDEARAKLEAK